LATLGSASRFCSIADKSTLELPSFSALVEAMSEADNCCWTCSCWIDAAGLALCSSTVSGSAGAAATGAIWATSADWSALGMTIPSFWAAVGAVLMARTIGAVDCP
jgi:hypothetical protein